MKVRPIRLWILLLLMIPIALLSAFMAKVVRVRVVKNESSCQGNLAQIAIHLLNYREGQGRYPPTIFTGNGSKPLHSWRAMLCANHVWDFKSIYNLAQPWNSPSNLAAVESQVSQFGCPNSPANPSGHTNYVAVIDRGVSSLERVGAIPKSDLDLAPQVLVVEYPNSDILWSEPRDIDVNDLLHLSAASDPHGLGVVFSDGRARRMPLKELLRLLGR